MMAAAFSALAPTARAARIVLPRAYCLGIATRIVLVEAALDDDGNDLVLVALLGLDILVFEAGLEQFIDRLLGDLGALDRTDDGC